MYNEQAPSLISWGIYRVINIIFHKKSNKTPGPLPRGKNQKSTNL